jgi:hypothetical protein
MSETVREYVMPLGHKPDSAGVASEKDFRNFTSTRECVQRPDGRWVITWTMTNKEG